MLYSAVMERLKSLGWGILALAFVIGIPLAVILLLAFGSRVVLVIESFIIGVGGLVLEVWPESGVPRCPVTG